MLGELRQGALEALLVEAIAEAAGVDAATLRRAVMVAGKPGPVAEALFREGGSALARFDIEPFRPVQPMLPSRPPTWPTAARRGRVRARA